VKARRPTTLAIWIATVVAGTILGRGLAPRAAEGPGLTLSVPRLDSLLTTALALWPMAPAEIGFRTDYEDPDPFRLRLVDRLLVNPRATAATAESLATCFERAPDLAAQVRVAAAALDLSARPSSARPPAVSGVPSARSGAVVFQAAAQRLAALESELTAALGSGAGQATWRDLLADGDAMLALSEDDATATIEAIAYEESVSVARTEAALALAAKLDRARLLESGAQLAELASELAAIGDSSASAVAIKDGRAPLPAWSGPPVVEGDVILVLTLPDGRPAVLGGPGPTRYLAPCGLSVDLGGDDVYLAGAGGNGGEPGRLALAVDLSGNDLYAGSEPYSLAAAGIGAGILIDGAGNDVYRAGDHNAGAAFGGVGILEDRAGDDQYLALTFSLGAGAFGFGCLRDRQGRDLYQGSAFTEGFGFTGGLGRLADDAGNDVYLAAPRFSDQLRDATTTLSLAQGFGYGARPVGSGGIGLLVDAEGQDRYLAEVFAQGAAYWCAFGALIDRQGNDHYDGFNYAQGSGVHVAVAALVDAAGNDDYQAKGVSQGCGHDLGLGMLVEGGGDDRYDASDLSQGAGNANGAGLLIDLGGNDALTVKTAATTQGYANPRRNRGSVGVVVNLGGDDRYVGGPGEDEGLWLGDEVAAGFDGEPALARSLAQLAGAPLATVEGVDLLGSPGPAGAPPARTPLEPPPNLPKPEAIPDSVRAMAFSRLYHRATTGEPRFATERDQARAELVRRGSAIVPDLASRLGTLSATERHAIKDVAVALGSVPVEKSFAQVMRGEDERSARAAVWCLERMEATGVESDLIQVARHPSWRMRSGAVTALARGGGGRSLATLIAALDDPVPSVRQAAAHALGERAELERGQLKPSIASDRHALPALVRALRDPDASVRFTAQRALGRVGAAASPALVAALAQRERGKSGARRTAGHLVAALGATSDPRVEPVLAQLATAASAKGDLVLEAECRLARGRLAAQAKEPPPMAGLPPEPRAGAGALLQGAVSTALGETSATRP